MHLICIRCSAGFEHDTPLGYCPGCALAYRNIRAQVHRHQRPAPGIYADGKLTSEPSPQSFWDADSGRQLCGLCGSADLESGYGLGSGYGMGSYTFCCACNTFLDFSEDLE